MRTRRITGKSDKDYWNARNYGIKKLIEKECSITDKICAEYLAKQAEMMKKQARMQEFRRVFENDFKMQFPQVFKDISSGLIQEWDRTTNNNEIVCANTQIQQILLRYEYFEALQAWDKLFKELKSRLNS